MTPLKHHLRSSIVGIGVLVLGLILTAAPQSLRAQSETSDGGNDDTAAARSARSDNAPAAQPLTFGERLKTYERSFVSPDSLVAPALGASYGQLRHSPPEWGNGAGGYGRRLASAYARSAIGRTIRFGVASIDREDTRFAPSNETGKWQRIRHAIAGTFVSRTDSGGAMPAYSRLADAYGSAFIANAWEPPSQNTTGDALKRGSTTLLWNVGWHVVQEFGPDIRHAFHHKRN